MKNALTVVTFPLFAIGLFANGTKISNVELESVTEGDSVTVKSGVTERKKDEGIEWRFNEIRIAKISIGSSEIWVKPDGSFKDRLQLDSQTGDLKISNIKTTDSGRYKPKVSSPRGSPPEMIFTVKVVSADGVKPMSVNEGDSVTLLTSLTEIQKYDVIQWRFGQQKSPVAEINGKAGIFSTYDGPDERFRDRLQLDHQTGSLIITNITATDSEVYEADISSSRYTIHKSFSVTVSNEMESPSVKEGESVILPIVTEIQKDDLIHWMFGGAVIAEIRKADQRFFTSDGPDGRFRGRLNHQTGSLIIMNTRTTDSGDYHLKISSSRCTINRRITVTVTGVFSSEEDGVKTVSVANGHSFTLHSNVTDIQNDVLIEWMFGPQNLFIAKTDGKSKKISYNNDVRFKNKVYLDIQTGDLSVQDSSTEHSGLYQLKIINSRYTIQKSFSVTVSGSGLSPGAIVGIVVGVLLVAAAAAAAAGVIYSHCCKKQKKRNKIIFE